MGQLFYAFDYYCRWLVTNFVKIPPKRNRVFLSRAQMVMWMLRVNERSQRALSFCQYTVWTWYVFSLKYHYF